MTDHVFGNKNGIKNLSVMNQKCVADKIRRHHRAARPGLNRFFRARAVHLVDLLQKMRLDEGSFLQRSCHKNQILVANPEVGNQEKISFFVFNSWLPSSRLFLTSSGGAPK